MLVRNRTKVPLRVELHRPKSQVGPVGPGVLKTPWIHTAGWVLQLRALGHFRGQRTAWFFVCHLSAPECGLDPDMTNSHQLTTCIGRKSVQHLGTPHPATLTINRTVILVCFSTAITITTWCSDRRPMNAIGLWEL